MSQDQFSLSAEPASKKERPPELERLERVLTFSREMANGLRKEFAPFWGRGAPPPGARPGPVGTAPLGRQGPTSKLSLGAGPRGATAPIGQDGGAGGVGGDIPEVRAFTARVDALLDLVRRGDAVVATAKDMPPAAAVMNVLGFDREAVVTAARGLDQQARALRGTPRVMGLLGPRRGALPPAGTQPLGGKPAGGTGQIMDAFRRLVSPVVSTAVPAEALTPTQAEAARNLAKGEKAREGIVSTVDMVTQVLNGLGPRLRTVSASLSLLGPVNAMRSWAQVEAAAPGAIEEHQVPPNMHRICLACSKVLMMNPTAIPRTHMVIEQWKQAIVLQDEAKTLLAAVKGPIVPRTVGMVVEFPIGRLRGAILPLTNLSSTFKGVPVFEKLFEAPSTAPA